MREPSMINALEKINISSYDEDEILIIKNPKDLACETIYEKAELVTASMERIKTRDTIPPFNKTVSPKSHPAHYLMHKYWGRKAHNVVSEYLQHYTEEGDVILDPFMGSGVTIIEASKLNRHSIGTDINPMSKFIVDNTLSSVDLKLFKSSYRQIIESVKETLESFYITTCPTCSQDAQFICGVWEKEELLTIRGKCEEHGMFVKEASTSDKALYCHAEKGLNKSKKVKAGLNEEIMQFVRRSGKTKLKELFSARALFTLSYISYLISQIDDKDVQKLLYFCLTSTLPNASKMLPGDTKKGTYKSGWVISKYWVPKVHAERNAISCFELRYKAVLKGKKELINLKNKSQTHIQDARNLTQLEDNSIDYIFTDPPYGDSIAYLGLSQLWNTWLQNEVDYSNEIIIDSFRNKDHKDFGFRLYDAFIEMSRVLKPQKYLSFTFHSRNLKTWRHVLESAMAAGFELANVVMQDQAVSSGTQGLNRKNTLKGDFVYNFINTKSPIGFNFKYHANAEEFIVREVSKILKLEKKVSAADLYKYLIPIIVNHHAYLDKANKEIVIDNVLAKNFSYSEESGNFFWRIK